MYLLKIQVLCEGLLTEGQTSAHTKILDPNWGLGSMGLEKHQGTRHDNLMFVICLQVHGEQASTFGLWSYCEYGVHHCVSVHDNIIPGKDVPGK